MEVSTYESETPRRGSWVSVTETSLDSKKADSKELVLTDLDTGNGVGMKRSPMKFSYVQSVPMFNSIIEIRHKFRFICSTSGTYSVTPNRAFGVVGGICHVANTSLRSLAGTIKFNAITIYCAASTSGAIVGDIVWLVNDLNRSKETDWIAVVPQGTTNTNSVRSAPPKGSAADLWFTSGAADSSIVSIAVGAGSVVEADMSFTLSNSFGGATLTVATATLGSKYHLALDGAASNKLVPLGLLTTS